MADDLKKAGLFSYGVGLDGANPEINDKIRNKKGAFEKSVWAIKALKARDIKVHVEFTITRINIGEISKAIDFLETIGVDTFLARAVLFSGRATKGDVDFRLTPQEYKKVLEELKAKSKNRKIILNCQDPLYHLVDEDLVEKLKEHGDIYSGKVISGCTVGINMVHIHADGNVGVCTFLPNVILGNIFEDSLVDIWNNRKAIPDVKRLIDREYNGNCGVCSDRFICGGGCRARALQKTNNMFDQDPYCWKYSNKNENKKREKKSNGGNKST